MKITKVTIGCILILIVMIVAVAATLYLGFDDINYRLRNREQFKEDLKMLGIDLIEGRVESPSVVITLAEKEEFLQKISDLNATVVYYKDGFKGSVTFWVFENMLCNPPVAYRFNYSGRD